jgi:hypothetical protein
VEPTYKAFVHSPYHHRVNPFRVPLAQLREQLRKLLSTKLCQAGVKNSCAETRSLERFGGGKAGKTNFGNFIAHAALESLDLPPLLPRASEKPCGGAAGAFETG